MKCPHCLDVDLAISDRQGVEIDYCPRCRGVWLDRGELDKILERSRAYEARAGHDDDDDDDDDRRRRASSPQGGYPQGGYPQGGYPQGGYPPPPPQGGYYPPGQGHYPHKHHKKKSFWEELFD